MSDAYDRNGVTITPGGGGWHELSHPGLGEPERVQGRDAAEKRADEISAEDGRMEKQADLSTGGKTPAPLQTPTTDGKVDGDPRTPAQKAQEREAGDRGTTAARSSDPKARQDGEGDDTDELASLRQRLADAEAERDKLKDAADKITTVVSDQQDQQAEPAVPRSIDRNYAGEMSKESKSALKKAGIDVVTIVLEENENIPPTGLFIGHNGRSYVIKPGEEVDVPEFLVKVLDDAVTSAPVVDSSTQKILGYRNRSKYPYRRVKG